MVGVNNTGFTVLLIVATFTLTAPLLVNITLPEYVPAASAAANRMYTGVAALVPVAPPVTVAL